MAALPYMQLYIADYLADTMHLSAEEHGAYLLLMFNYWQTGKPIPKSRLAKIARVSNERWNSVESSLKEFFIDTGEEWMHGRIESDLEEVRSKLSQKSAAGKASAAKRKAKKSTPDERETNDRPTGVDSPLEPRSNENPTNKDPDPDKDTELKDPPCSPPEGKSPRGKLDPLSVELPEWLPRDLWAEWVAYRKQLGKPIKTQQGISGSLNKLEAYRAQGYSPEFVVRLTMENEWRGLLVPDGTPKKTRRDVNSISPPDTEIPLGFRGNNPALDGSEPETVWPAEVNMVFSQVERAGTLPAHHQYRLLNHINRMWLEKMPVPAIIDAARSLVDGMGEGT